MAMSSLMAARSVGQNSGPIFRRLWTKVHQISSPVTVSIVCNAHHFPTDDVLLHSGDIHN